MPPEEISQRVHPKPLVPSQAPSIHPARPIREICIFRFPGWRINSPTKLGAQQRHPKHPLKASLMEGPDPSLLFSHMPAPKLRHYWGRDVLAASGSNTNYEFPRAWFQRVAKTDICLTCVCFGPLQLWCC
ncbi:hypothetical protein HZ326_27350 [Fusarium oxysporum f. sp. albedinis]|nr:hypothetical protein HZ326_27350 [Fusarium oxysporum f. sp. albedinis]